MNDCKVCIHYDCCCGWTSKEVIDSLEEAVEEGICYECKYFKAQRVGKWVVAKTERAWNNAEVPYMHKCSLCGNEQASQDLTPYCPYCGAKMEENYD